MPASNLDCVLRKRKLTIQNGLFSVGSDQCRNKPVVNVLIDIQHIYHGLVSALRYTQVKIVILFEK
jgi:hypothetical protein